MSHASSNKPHVAITAHAMLAPLNFEEVLAGQYITSHSRVPITIAPGQLRAIQLATLVAKQAVARCPSWSANDPQTALIVGTSKGPIDNWFAPLPPTSDNLQQSAGGLHPTGLAEIAAELSTTLHLPGPHLTLSAACVSGLHALIRACMMIQSGQVERALVVAVESSFHPLFQASFQRLGILPPCEIGCRPFDHSRAGFLMSEAAAAVVVERVEVPQSNAIVVDRFAMGGDATHLTGSDPQGRVLRHLLAHVINNRPLDLIHAHGTGTLLNDSMELAALESSLIEQDPRPTLYSHKAALGHSLGAAGLLAVVINCECHRRGIIPPNPRTLDPLSTERVSISAASVRRKIQRSIVAASGFGGPTAAVSIETV